MDTGLHIRFNTPEVLILHLLNLITDVGTTAANNPSSERMQQQPLSDKQTAERL
jgi:hypothetical protein